LEGSSHGLTKIRVHPTIYLQVLRKTTKILIQDSLCSFVKAVDESLKQLHENMQDTSKNVIQKRWISNMGMRSKEIEGKFVLTFPFRSTEKCV
jgi:hypothetical protein